MNLTLRRYLHKLRLFGINIEESESPGSKATGSVSPSTTPALNLSTPSAQLPPLKIPAPTTATESSRHNQFK